MALIRLSSLIGSISGSLGPITFRNTRNGPLATKRLTRTKQRSPAQQQSDSRWTALTRAWDNLTPANRLAWSTLARQLTHTNSLGVTYPRSGFALYTQHASPAYHASIPLPTTPPTYGPLPQLTDTSITFDVVTGYSIAFTSSGPIPLPQLLTFGSRPVCVPRIHYLSPTKYPAPHVFKSWRFLRINAQPIGIRTETLTTHFKAALGTCAPIEAVAVRAFLWHTDALASPPVYLYTFVTP